LARAYLGLSAKSSSPRVKKKILGEDGNSKKKTIDKQFFAESQLTGPRRRNSSPRVFFALGKEIFKKHFSLQTFFIINTHLYKGYVQI
jgi:hypothetical protein